jgi:CRP/FNR family transcriptional regulator, cyclic AMP receptor protein
MWAHVEDRGRVLMFRNSKDYEETYHDGDIIVREGEERREMYVIRSGEVVVTKRIDGREVEIARLARGNFFGEMSLLESHPRYATIRAVGDTQLVVVKPGSLLLKIRRNPTFAFEMLQQMSRRIRHINDKLVELASSGAVSEEVSKKIESFRLQAEYSPSAGEKP